MVTTTVKERRRRYLEIALRRIQPGTGSSPAFFCRREWTETPVNLGEIRTPFLVIGDVATRLYMPERATRDLDLLVHRDDAGALYSELSSLGLIQVSPFTVGGSKWADEHGFEFDVLESDQSWTREALRAARRAPDGLPVVALPYLVLLKMNASRGIDIGDLTRMLGLATDAELDDVRQVVATHQPDDLDDLEGLITLGAIEFGRPHA